MRIAVLKKSALIAICGIVMALSLVTSFLPFVFFIPVLVACTLQDLRLSIFCGLMFGVISFIYSYFIPVPIALVFQKNPLVPIVPRLLVVILVHFGYMGAYKLFNSRIFAAVVAAVVGSVSNTMLVLAALVLFGYASESYFDLIIVTFGLDALIEIILNILIVPPISMVLYKSRLHNIIMLDNNTVTDTLQ